jgi:3-oxoacyl-[acyl-carrier-protein] synthase II
MSVHTHEIPRRVVITGMGVIAPNGQDLGTFWRSVREGISAAGPISRFNTSALPSKIGCEIKDFDPSRYMDGRKSRRFELSIQYAIAASVLAARDSAIDFARIDPERVGVVEGGTVSAMESNLKGQIIYLEKGYKAVSPFVILNSYFGGGSGEIAIELGIKGHAVSYSSSSATGNDVMGYAFNLIRQDEVDIMLAGGSEAPLLEPLWGGFCQTGVMTCRNDRPREAMRPFDRTRDGFLLGEGAAFVVLEELAHALARGASIYAEVVGHGRSCEAYHSVAPHPDGVGLCRAMEKALRQARLHSLEIDYINAHGTATETNDVVETKAIKTVFGEHAHQIGVSSTKPVTGHLLGAAGALETVIVALAIKNQEMPPTLNLKEPEVGCDLDYVPNKGRRFPIRAAMNLNVGFGGKNSCLILRQFPGRQ